MPNLARVHCVWSGWSGGNGYSTFHFDESGTGFVASVRTLFDAIKAAIPVGISMQVANVGELIDPSDGHLVGSWSESSVAAVAGGASAGFALATGALVRWETGMVYGGSRVRGHTYFVPITGGCFGFDGNLTATWVTNFKTAADALVAVAGNELRVWARPKPVSTTHPAGMPGTSYPVTSTTVPIKGTVLRSRRD